MDREFESYLVILEEPQGPVEFRVRVTAAGGIHWTAGKYLLSGKPCVRLNSRFAERLRQAVRLIRETTPC